MEQINLKGLTSAEVEASRAKYGANVFKPIKPTPWWIQLLDKFKDPLIIILLVALVASFGIAIYHSVHEGQGFTPFLEPIGIAIAILLATVIGFVMEYNANKKFEMLNKINDDTFVKVKRNGTITQISRKEFVVGDVVMFETGEEIPADGTIFDSVSLSINEHALTGDPIIAKSHKA